MLKGQPYDGGMVVIHFLQLQRWLLSKGWTYKPSEVMACMDWQHPDHPGNHNIGQATMRQMVKESNDGTFQ